MCDPPRWKLPLHRFDAPLPHRLAGGGPALPQEPVQPFPTGEEGGPLRHREGFQMRERDLQAADGGVQRVPLDAQLDRSREDVSGPNEVAVYGDDPDELCFQPVAPDGSIPEGLEIDREFYASYLHRSANNLQKLRTALMIDPDLPSKGRDRNQLMLDF